MSKYSSEKRQQKRLKSQAKLKWRNKKWFNGNHNYNNNNNKYIDINYINNKNHNDTCPALFVSCLHAIFYAFVFTFCFNTFFLITVASFLIFAHLYFFYSCLTKHTFRDPHTDTNTHLNVVYLHTSVHILFFSLPVASCLYFTSSLPPCLSLSLSHTLANIFVH